MHRETQGSRDITGCELFEEASTEPWTLAGHPLPQDLLLCFKAAHTPPSMHESRIFMAVTASELPERNRLKEASLPWLCRVRGFSLWSAGSLALSLRPRKTSRPKDCVEGSVGCSSLGGQEAKVP